MTPFSTIIGQYNSTLLSLADGQHSIVALDQRSRLIQDHTTASISIGDGTDLLHILVHDESYLTATPKTGVGIFVVRKDDEGSLVDADGDFTYLTTDNRGRLRVTAATPGAEGDVGCDEDNASDGEVTGVTDIAWFDIVDIPVADGTEYNISAVDATADRLCQLRLVVWDSNQTPGSEIVKNIRKFIVTENIATAQLLFPRNVEIIGAEGLSVKLQAKRLRAGTNATVSGGINGFHS